MSAAFAAGGLPSVSAPVGAPKTEAIEEDGSPAQVETAGESSINVWPDESAEAAFLSEQREIGGAVPVASAGTVAEEAETGAPLPALDELVQRIPAKTRAVMDELFRAKFVAVKRVPKSALKS